MFVLQDLDGRMTSTMMRRFCIAFQILRSDLRGTALRGAFLELKRGDC